MRKGNHKKVPGWRIGDGKKEYDLQNDDYLTENYSISQAEKQATDVILRWFRNPSIYNLICWKGCLYTTPEYRCKGLDFQSAYTMVKFVFGYDTAVRLVHGKATFPEGFHVALWFLYRGGRNNE